MSIPLRLAHYLEQHQVLYEVSEHRWSRSSAQTARLAHVPPRSIAKSVILEDDDGLLMAVVPADKYVLLGRLGQLLNRHQLHLSDEERIATVFADCDRGAVPPVGMAWGIATVVDEELEDHDPVYLEGGDHQRLLRLSRDQFRALMRTARHGQFCRSPLH